jgi:PAS domain S-box-containing protein
VPADPEGGNQREWVEAWREAVRVGPLAAGLMELPSSRFIEVSPRAADLLGTTPEAAIGIHYLAIVEPRRAAQQTLRLVRTGGLESAQARRRLRRVDGSMVEGSVSTRAIRSSVGVDLVLWLPVEVLADEARSLEPDLAQSAAGALDLQWPPASADEDPGTRSEPTRAAALEHHLQRIALEVQAAGVMHALERIPGAIRVPALSELSARQWEVVARLARGERVSMIASAMFVSQSTVRNHLSVIFSKVGVHSQQELLELLRGEEWM